MSEKTLALIFINLGGEMLYVLDQRLYAQKINTEKGNKIMQDIVSNMFSERFLEEIFRPQETCSRKALRTIFERLAHTSIMRLNESSMDKLFDLMTMAVKYQMSLITRPRELLLVTFNHLDSIMNFIGDSSLCVDLIEKCYKRVSEKFLPMSDYELQFVRYSVLNFFQDLKIKVSVFLKEKVQNWDGTFILFKEGPVSEGTDLPGLITYYDADQETVIKEAKFNPIGKYKRANKEGSYERHGDRITKLGLNVYSSNKPVDTIIPPERMNKKNNQNITISDLESNIPDPKAIAQLDLLCRLIGKSSAKPNKGEKDDFKLNLFNNDEEEFIYNTSAHVNENYEDEQFDSKYKRLEIDASKRQRDDRLSKVMNQFDSRKEKPIDKHRLINKDKNKGSSGRHTAHYDDDDDDEDDIVALMDKMN